MFERYQKYVKAFLEKTKKLPAVMFSKLHIREDYPYFKKEESEFELGFRLIFEEILELADAYHLKIFINGSELPSKGLKEGTIQVVQDKENEVYIDAVEVVDALADITYTVSWNYWHLSIPDDVPNYLVAYSNNTKFREGWYFDEYGKVIKSPKYEPADVMIFNYLMRNEIKGEKQ